jgi:hypothetical protein
MNDLVLISTTTLLVRVRVTLRLAVYRQSVRLGAEPVETHAQNLFFSQMNTCGDSPYITSSPTREWVCHLQLLLALASTFILGSESRVTRDHILLSQIRDLPFCRLRLAGIRWRYSTPPPRGTRFLEMGLHVTIFCASRESKHRKYFTCVL